MNQASRRARDLRIVVGALPTGRHNAITDVPGVRVGHTTLDDGADVHTGVTAVVPAELGPGRWTLPAAVYCGNGYGKLVGSTQVDELGVLESPTVLTATLSVFRVADALLGHLLDAVEEALLNSLLTAVTTTGVGGRTSHAVPHDLLVRRLSAVGRLTGDGSPGGGRSGGGPAGTADPPVNGRSGHPATG
ncbi:P1 family peptidase [Micromonospora inyonensis]|nr:P1 family peptidase [Micromonospora inyonensis]